MADRNQSFEPRHSRREALRRAGSLAAGAALAPLVWSAPKPRPLPAETGDRPRIAAVITEFTYRSHAHVILENFLKPYLFNGQKTESGMDIVSMYVDQFPEGDMARAVSAEYHVPIFPAIAEALTVGGGELAVDGVLSIGEHGNYPHNEKGQHEYPRKRFFDEIAAVCRRSGRGVPVFNDKHLSYRWDWAREMYDVARELNMPLMAGSSVPLAQRRPPLELPADAPITAAVSIHAGGVESYDFHALEVLQSQLEFRRGGENGVDEVQFLSGAALWQAGQQGKWSIALAEAAMAAELGPGLPPLSELCTQTDRVGHGEPHGILIRYRDGLSAIALTVGGSATRWNFACQLAGEDQPRATAYYVGPWQNRNLFKALAHAIQTHFRQGRPPYPVERTLLTTGIVAAAMDSRYEQSRPVRTPHLAIAYPPQDFRAQREMGASWRIITEDMPEPKGIDPGPLG